MKNNIFDANREMNMQNPDNIREQVDFIENLLEKHPPYKELPFDANWYCKLIEIKKIAIDDYCKTCGAIKVFQGAVENLMNDTFAADIMGSCPRPSFGVDAPPATPIFMTKQYSIYLSLKCAKCNEQHYYSILFMGDKIFKIGQYPSFAEKETQEIKKYKNVISKYYIELIRAENAYSMHMGIASFVYLRRIYEHIIETEYAKLSVPDKNDKTSFDDKMKRVNKEIKIIPPVLDAQKSKIYSVLSKGIHEYEEQECYDIYPIMKTIILITLERYLAEKEQRKQLDDLREFLERK